MFEFTFDINPHRGVGSSSVITRLLGCKRSWVQIPAPRPSFKLSPSTKMSKGFLFVVYRFTSPKVRFKQIESRMSRRIALFEPRHVSAAF